MAGKPADLIAEARERWTLCQEAEEAQRKAILAAKQFRAGDQWPTAIKIAREGGNALQGQSPQPPRPCEVIDRLSQPCRQVSNAIKDAEFGFEVLPNGGGANDDTAEQLQGYLRWVHNEARSEGPVEWAADQAVEGGLGWFRILTKYAYEAWDGESDDPAAFDQIVALGRIANNLTVYCDPYASSPTRSDAQFLFVTEDLAKSEFERRWPKADVAGLEDFAATGDCPIGWVTKETIRIAEYWRITYESKTLSGPNGLTRTLRIPKVKGSKINAFQELPQEDGKPDTWDWLGSRIPLIPVLGEELNIDGKTKLRGIIEEGMGAQRMVNYTYNGAMETFALAPKSPILADAQAIGNYKAIWQTANTVNYAYLPYDSFDASGRPLAPPQRAPTDAGPAIQAAVGLMQISSQAINDVTGFHEPSRGQTTGQERSGTAIQSAQQQFDLATSHYPDNVERAMIYASSLMLELIAKITRPGQLLHILGEDDQPDQILAGQPFTRGPNGDQPPTPSPEDVTPAIAAQSNGLHQFYDFAAGRYAVTVTIGKASATRQQEGAQALGELIPHLPPEMAAVATPDYVRQLSFPGAIKIAERLEQALPPNLQPQKPGGGDPQTQGIIQQLQQQLQQAQQIIQSKSAEAQAKGQIDIQIAQLDNDTKLKVAGIQAQAGLAEAEVKAGIADMKVRIEVLETMINVQKEARLEEQKNAHEAARAAQDHTHTMIQAEQAHGHTLEQAAANVVGGMAQASHQQAITPPEPQPEPAGQAQE